MEQIKILLEHEFQEEVSLFPILDIVDPLVLAAKVNSTFYLVHVIQDRVIKTTDGFRAKVLEIVVSNSSYDILEKVSTGKMPLLEAILTEKPFRIGRISNKIYPKQYIEDLPNYISKLPKEGFCLDDLIPNRIDITELLNDLKKSI